VRPCSSALLSFLDNPANLDCVQVDLYTIALASGEMLRWSGGDAAITVPPAGFPTGSINYGMTQSFMLGPRFGRSKITTKIGVEPAELDIDIMAGESDLVGTFPLAAAVRMGIFDGATVELDRLFAPPATAGFGLDTSLGTLLWFYGRVADTDVGRSKISMKVKSLMNLLAIQQMPRRLYGAGCTHIFGDAMCGFNRTTGRNALGGSTGAGAITIAALSSSTQAVIDFSGTIATWFNGGTITGLTGANAGYSRNVTWAIGSQIGVIKAWLYPVGIGDTFTVLAGCDHTTATCNGTFNNLLRFGGFPYIPPPEYAV
jgi:uncharacterized phage protein (TIGR02218 family)